MPRKARVGVVCLLGILISTARAGAQNRNNNGDSQDLQQRVVDLERRVEALERALNQRPETTGVALAAVPSPQPQPPVEPPPQPPRAPRLPFSTPPELIPEVGKIGAEVGLLVSGSSNPFHLNQGSFSAGFIDLPLVDRPAWLHGKLSYEIMVGMSQSKTTTQTTSNVAQVANLAVLNTLNPNGGLNNVTSAVTGTGAAPFPVTSSTITKLRLLQVVPFSIKYTSTAFDRWRLRPYAVFGFGAYVTIHNQTPVPGTTSSSGVRQDADLPSGILAAVNQIFGGQAPFGGPLVAGQLSQAPELEARGLPGGHGNMDLGIHSGFGFEYRVGRSLSLGFDNRYNRIAGAPGLLITYGTRIGVHF
jgi:hypothetical protein